MRKIFTCIDIGSHSIKIVVSEEINHNFVVLSHTIVKSKGIKNGFIIEEEDVLNSLKKAFDNIEKDLGIKIDNILCIIPSNDADISITTGIIKISDEAITRNDVTKVLHDSVLGKIEEDKILVELKPIYFKVDNKEDIKNVVGMSGKELSVKAVMVKVPKKNVVGFFDIFKKLNKNIIDVSLGIIGDYEAVNFNDLDNHTTAIVNIGYNKTEIGIFNKGILIKDEVLNIGSKSVDNDISYMYSIERKKSRFLKETFACSSKNLADYNDVTIIKNKEGNNISINQGEISEIIEARINDILNQVKKQINILTNKEIRYIIVTGGITELSGFQSNVERMFGYGSQILEINNLGIRNNSYSSSYGSIRSFSDKLHIKQKEYSMINENNMDLMNKKYRKTTSENNNNFNILNIFTGNKED